MQAQHVSLHASGKRHITLDPRAPSAGKLREKQFLNQWQESDEKTPTFRLVFPWWGVQLDAAQRNRFKSLWKKNLIFVEGHREFLTVFAFYVVRRQARLNKVDSLPGFVLAEPPLSSGEKLAITAEWQPDPGIESAGRRALKQVPSTYEFPEEGQGRTFGLCMTGTIGSADSIYMVSIPATLSKLG